MTSIVAPFMRAHMAQGPITIMVPDFGDPCGSRKIGRVVDSVCMIESGGEGKPGTWAIGFAGDYLYPMILRTTSTHPYTITTDAPVESGPCEGCRADAARREKDAQDARDAEDAARTAERAYSQEAERQGFADGEHAAAERDINGTPLPNPVQVPARYTDAGLETYYVAGFESGVDHYDETGGEDAFDDVDTGADDAALGLVFSELEVIDSQVSATVVLSERDAREGTLRLPSTVVAEVADGPLIVCRYRESIPGIGSATLGNVRAERQGVTLTGLDWPSDVVAGTPVTVTTGRGPGVCRIRVDIPNLPEEMW